MKAIIPCAGEGTRFAPITPAIPKEMVPVVDRPAINYAVIEAVHAGVDHVVIITSKGKDAIADYLEQHALCSFSYTRQAQPLGLGHAVLQAAPLVSEDSFAVILPDDIYWPPCALQRLRGAHNATGKAVVALMWVPREQAHRYGIADASAAQRVGNTNTWQIHSLVEKPTEGIPLEPLAVVGRYILPTSIFSTLESMEPGRGGEIQLTDALQVLAREGQLIGVECAERRFDVGNPVGWLEANISISGAGP